MIRRSLRLFCLVLAVAAAGCDKDSSDTPPDGGVEQITGNERIGWQQAAATPAELSTFRYNIYVDNVATEMQGVSCTAASGGFSCSGPLPSIAPSHACTSSCCIWGSFGGSSLDPSGCRLGPHRAARLTPM